MIIKKVKRKLYNLTHPVVGEIWMLHRVVEQQSDKPKQRDLEVTVDWLELKILEYKNKGCNFVSIDNIPKPSTFHFPLSTSICITLDDGYHDNYTLAYPMFKRLGVPFTVYATTGFMDNQLPIWWYPGEQLGISMEELKQLDSDPLCTIGAHTVSHPKLDSLTHEQQYREIAKSKHTLENLLGHEVRHFSFPHGAHNADTIAICRELGFQSTVQSWGGPLRCGVHPYVLPRINMTQK